MLSFHVGRSQAAVKEVLPARKSLRLQKKEAETLTLPPEPRDTLFSERVAKYKNPHFMPLHCFLSFQNFFFLL